VSARVFGISGVPRGDELYPGYPLAAFVQFAADVVAAIRFVREGDVAPLRAADLSLATLALDATRIAYAGNSMGSVVGTSVLAVEPAIERAVLNVPPGAIVENLVESPEFRALSTAALLPILGVDARAYDEIDRHLVLDPIVDLFRWALEPVDPLALAPHLGTSRPILFQPAALDEVASPRATQSLLAAAGATRVTTYDPAGHGMLEELDQRSQYEPPYDLPLVPRPAPIPVRNPIGAIHDEITAFLRAAP
jgi:pimeloyl-ACP methyl ester carboxylesterase